MACNNILLGLYLQEPMSVVNGVKERQTSDCISCQMASIRKLHIRNACMAGLLCY